MGEKNLLHASGPIDPPDMPSRSAPSGIAVPSVEPAELNRRRKDLERLCGYMSRLMSLSLEAGEQFPIFLLLDRDGVVLYAYAGGQIVCDSPLPGARPGNVWTAEVMGSSAVTIGRAADAPAATVGGENSSPVLKDYAVYYSPLVAYSQQPPATVITEGGVALLVPAEQAHQCYLTLARTVTHDLVTNIHLHQCVNWCYQHFGQTSISAGVGFYQTDSPLTITHFDKSLFKLLEIPPLDLFGQPLDRLIDPYPKNADFWDALEKRLHLIRHNTILSVGGKEINCILTICPLYQPQLKMDGFDIIINTAAQSIARVASKVGNSAIYTFDDIIGASTPITTVIRKAKMLARTTSNILITGESGVGKDVFAQAIHNASPRRDGPFIAVNCAAIPRDLLASELFGYEAGAFTGARRQGNVGKFGLANGGTLFLDEIGDIPLDLQTLLLRAVEQKSFMRLGSDKLIHADVRIIAATNANIPKMIEAKTFRADLFYRLSTMQLTIPPLRERADDAVLLAENFIRIISDRIGRTEHITLDDSAAALLKQISWKGNVRELQNLIDRIVQLHPGMVVDRACILDHLDVGENLTGDAGSPPPAAPEPTPAPVPADSGAEAAAPDEPDLYGDEDALLGFRIRITKEALLHALRVCGGNRSKAAKYLGISRKTLYRYMTLYRAEKG